MYDVFLSFFTKYLLLGQTQMLSGPPEHTSSSDGGRRTGTANSGEA